MDFTSAYGFKPLMGWRRPLSEVRGNSRDMPAILVGIAVGVGGAVGTGVLVGIAVGVGVAVGTGVLVGVVVGVGVAVGTGVLVGVAIGVGVAVGAGVLVGVAIGVGVAVGAGVLVGVGVAAGTGVFAGLSLHAEKIAVVTAQRTIARMTTGRGQRNPATGRQVSWRGMGLPR